MDSGCECTIAVCWVINFHAVDFLSMQRKEHGTSIFHSLTLCIWNEIKISDNIVVLIFSIFNSFIFVIFQYFNICLLELTIKRRLSFILTWIVTVLSSDIQIKIQAKKSQNQRKQNIEPIRGAVICDLNRKLYCYTVLNA